MKHRQHDLLFFQVKFLNFHCQRQDLAGILLQTIHNIDYMIIPEFQESTSHNLCRIPVAGDYDLFAPADCHFYDQAVYLHDQLSIHFPGKKETFQVNVFPNQGMGTRVKNAANFNVICSANKSSN